MAIKSEALIYKIIEKHLRESSEPLTCTDLWDFTDVKKNAKSVEKVSDYLGLMWRRNLIQRWEVAARANSKSRFGYTWKEADDSPTPISSPTERTPLSVVGGRYKRPDCTITEDNERIVLDFDKYTIIIQSKV